MEAVPRILHTNRLQAAASALTSSSVDPAFAVSWLLDQMRSKVWRSQSGWTVTAGVNDKMNFNRSGVKTATIAAGTYATGAALCTALVTALEAADATPVWAATYSGSTFKFTLSSDIAFVLLWGTGADAASAIGFDLGFAASDTGSATSQVGATVAYQSSHWVKVDFGSALSVAAGVALNHNVSAAGTIRLQGNATDVWTAPTVNQLLSTSIKEKVQSPAGRLVFVSETALRYWRFVFSDVSNTDGFVEAGILYAGPYVEIPQAYSTNFLKRRMDLSQIYKAVRGAHYQDQRPMQRLFQLEWMNEPDSTRAILEGAFDLTPKGLNFFFAFDAVGDPANTLYCYHDSDIEVGISAGLLWRASIVLAEAMP